MNSFYLPPPTTALCDSSGRLNPAAVGWSAWPRVDCSLPGNRGRRKRWNHWCVSTPDWTLSIIQADLDYVRYGAVYFVDLQSGEGVSHSQLSLFGHDCELPDNPLASHSFNHPRLQLQCIEHTGRLRLTAAAPGIAGRALQLAIDIQRPAHLQSMNLVAPLGKGHFHASCRQVGLPASGSVKWGDHEYACTATQGFAAMDCGRGVWPMRSHWTRAVFAAPGGVAANFGSGWTDHSGLSENALWLGGELQRLDQQVGIRRTAKDRLAAWTLLTADARVELQFTPRQYYQVKPRLGLLYAETQIWFGQYHGLLRGPDGEGVPVQGAHGWLGTANALW